MHAFQFDAPHLPPDALAARRRVREFLAAEQEAGHYTPHRSSWSTFDGEFSRRAGAAGFIGVTWPKEFGGQALSSLVRFVITQEMLAAGAPCFAHWIADRQSGPQILRHGSERAKRLLLPRICRGECFFGIGMSEPNSGSDLAAVRTRAVKRGDGWVINGSQDLDVQRPSRALPHRARAHRRRRRGSPRRADAVHRRSLASRA